MTYTPNYPGGWKNRPDLSTAVTAEALDHIEEGIADVEGQLSGYVPRSATPPDHTIAPAYVDTSTVPPSVKGWNGSAFVAIGGGSTGVVDNGDGTWTSTSGLVDNGDGTWTA